jgi:hypothetical protein
MLDIWQEIVQTDSVAPTGATGLHLQEDLLALLAVPQLAESVLAMLLTENTSNSCKNFPAVLQRQLLTLLTVSKPAQVVMINMHPPMLQT